MVKSYDDGAGAVKAVLQPKEKKLIKTISLITAIIVNILAFTLYFNIAPNLKIELDRVQSELDRVQSELDDVQSELDGLLFCTITDTTTYYDLKLKLNQTRSIKLVAVDGGSNVEVYDNNGVQLDASYSLAKNDILFITVTYTNKINVSAMKIHSGSTVAANQHNYEDINNLSIKTPSGNISLFIW